jgi:IS30 family transposase
MDAKVKTALRNRIRALLQAGETQAAIAVKLDKAPSTIAHHVRALGIAAKEYFTPLPVHRGKRRCVSCRKKKTPGAFPSARHATCTVCIRAKV